MKKPIYKRWWFIAIVVMFAIGIIGNIATGWEGLEDEPKKVTTSSEKPVAKKDEPKKELTIEDQVSKIITDNIGDKTNMKKDRIVESKVFDLGDGTRNIILTLNASENLSNKMTRQKMWMDSVEILEPLDALENIENISIEWLLPLVDQYGNQEDGRIMMFDMPREVRDKINWENFNNENIPSVSEGYFEHPALSK